MRLRFRKNRQEPVWTNWNLYPDHQPPSPRYRSAKESDNYLPFVCNECGALVVSSGVESHDRWHTNQRATELGFPPLHFWGL